jgi:cytochrome c oxidase subunit 2
VRYEQPGAQAHIVLANELHLPTDSPVELLLSSADVIHSFWVPALAGKVDMIPGRTTRLVLKSSAPGRFRGQCAEYCGGQHAWMALFVVAEPRERFDAWLAQQARPVEVPSDPFLKLGHDAFFKGGCDKCHAVRGTAATAQLGPDLTHVGSRESLAAGMFDNHAGTMAGWIAGAQEVKPGNFMPSMAVYGGRELRSVSAWLESLE